MVNPSLVNAHKTMWEKTPYQLGGPTVKRKTLAIPATTSDYQQEIFVGKLPERVVVMMVEASHFSGTYVTNPFNFQHFNVQHIIMRYNGKQIPIVPYAPTWTNPIPQYRYEITKMEMVIKKLMVNPSLVNAHKTMWQKMP